MIEEERVGSRGRTPFWVIEEHAARFRFAARYTPGRLVVDCACGDGTGLLEFAGAAKHAIGIDLSHSAVVSAASRCAALGNVSVLRADATAWPLASQSAEAIVALETIEHLKDDEAFLSEVSRVLKRDGVFLCSTPNRRVTHPGAPATIRPMNPFHAREYTTAEFVSLLEHRFHAIELLGQNPQGRWKTLLFEWLATVLPLHLAARLNQLTKLHRFLYYSRATANPRPIASATAPDYEYVVAVCRRPIPGPMA